MVSSGRSSSTARACDRDMHVVMLQICKGNKSSELNEVKKAIAWWKLLTNFWYYLSCFFFGFP
jgi:hypothetical protein